MAAIFTKVFTYPGVVGLCTLFQRVYHAYFLQTVSIHINCVVRQQMFSRCFAETSVFTDLNATRPDFTIIDENNRNGFNLEVGCCFDWSLEEAYLTKLVNYNPLVQQISGLGHKSQYLVVIFSSLGHVHRPVIRVSGWLALQKQGQTLPNIAQ